MLEGCNNRSIPFPGWMSSRRQNVGLVFVVILFCIVLRLLVLVCFCRVTFSFFSIILLHWPRLVESVMFQSGVRPLLSNVNRERVVFLLILIGHAAHSQRDSPGTGAACDVATVYFRLSIRRTDVLALPYASF